MAEVWLGTSGWSYPEWVGRFYPNGTSPPRMLEFYGHRFRAVEAHSTFRRLPDPSVLRRWTASVPEAFRFVPKANAGITHRRDLDSLEDRVLVFLDSLAPLGSRLGPVLFSFPHAAPDLTRLERVLTALAAYGGVRAAFDLKSDWHTPEVLTRLDRAGAAFVVTDREGNGTRDEGRLPSAGKVGELAYVRLRRERYDRAALERWAEGLVKARADGREVYAFVKHDELGHGPRYARQLQAAIARLG